MQLRLISIQSNILPQIKELYENAFPEYERRNWQQQQRLLKEERLYLSEIGDGTDFIGFVFYWQLDGFIFIEHFAIAETERGKGTGTLVMKLLADAFRTIVLETEIEEKSTDATRRIRFYERLGYTKFLYPYRQPPYTPGGSYYDMHLMYYNLENKSDTFVHVKNEIYNKVYGINTGK